jgi:hypothetical protein
MERNGLASGSRLWIHLSRHEEVAMAGKAGDRIVVESEQVGTPEREGEILEVIQRSAGVSYRVRWNDGRESVFTPSVGSARVIPKRRRRQR